MHLFACRNRIYSPGDVNGKVPRFKHWGWLNPAGGLLTTLHDLAQVSTLSMIIIINNNNNNGILTVSAQSGSSPVKLTSYID